MIHARLFGHLQLADDAQNSIDLESHKAQELLSYLLVHRDQRHPREQLADVLWGECASTQQCRSYLRKALWQIQKALEPYYLASDAPLLLAEADSIQINPGAPLWYDVAVLEDAYARVRGMQGHELSAEQCNAVQAAVHLYRGDLLEGWYETWCIYERERLHHIFVILIDKLMAWCEANGAWEDAVIYGDLILRYEPAHERTHRRLMRLYYQMRDRTSALRQYAHCVSALDQELGVEPSGHTLAVYRCIRDDQPLPGRMDEHAPTVPSLTETLERLQQLQDLLASAQREINHSIHAVEQSMIAQG